MNRDDIIRMAKESGGGTTWWPLHTDTLERFAALVVEHYKDGCERELTEAIKEMQERGLGQ